MLLISLIVFICYFCVLCFVVDEYRCCCLCLVGMICINWVGMV